MSRCCGARLRPPRAASRCCCLAAGGARDALGAGPVRRADRGAWRISQAARRFRCCSRNTAVRDAARVLYGFLASCTVLLVASWVLKILWVIELREGYYMSRQNSRHAGQGLHRAEHRISGLHLRSARGVVRYAARAPVRARGCAGAVRAAVSRQHLLRAHRGAARWS